jgi:YegS C-terminal NAD kinase beta sandwich-like domain
VTRRLRPGEPWGRAASGPPDVQLTGDDADLAALVARHPGALVRFRPSPRSDLARALGLGPEGAGTTEVAIDALALARFDAVDVSAVNMVVLGPAPDHLRWGAQAARMTVTVDGRPWFSGRATTIVVANGQFLRRADLVPRGHPGDGWAEVQVYALARRERRSMRRRLPTGTHVPHPRVQAGRARRVDVEVSGRRLPLEVDGRGRGRTDRLAVALVPAAIRLLV